MSSGSADRESLPRGERDARRARLRRFAVIGSLAAIAAVAALIVLGGGGGTVYRIEFQNAGQLVKGDEVQVGGVKAGTIDAIRLMDNNHAEVEVTVEEPYAPLHEGTRAVIRATSLSGIANRYIALTPGPSNARELEEGAALTAEDSLAPVDLDQLFNMLDPEAQADLQQITQGLALQYSGHESQANAAIENFAPAVSTAGHLVSELAADEAVLTRFLVDSSRVVGTLAERRDDLAALIGNANATAAAIGDENVALAQALGLLPETLRRGNTTFVNLRRTLDDLDVLVAASKPATKDLARFLRELRPLVAAAEPTIRDLRVLVRKAGEDNDLTELLVDLPPLERITRSVLPRATATMQRAQPVVEFIRPYTPDLVGWLRDFGQGASTYDANGHYARIQPMFNAFQFNDNPLGGVLTALDPSSRLVGLDLANTKRCPGGATQARPDGSNPFLDTENYDCDPSQVPPG